MTSRQLLDVMPFFQPSVDRNGATFVLPDHVYRAFGGESAQFYRRLLRSNELRDAFDAGLVRCWEANVEIEGFDFVIECQRVPVVSYPMEWPTAMLKEAALCIARVGAALAERGLGLQDAHPWNVLFDGARAVFVDVGSIVPERPVDPAWTAEFRRHLLLPLALRRLRLNGWADEVARTHRKASAKWLWDAPLLRALFPPGFRRLGRVTKNPAAFFTRLHAYVQRLPDGAGRSAWSDYAQSQGADIERPSTYALKQQAVDAVLRRVGPGLLLDLGANAGWYSELAVRCGNRVIAVDTDDWTLSQLYDRAKKHNLPILPLRLDIMWPTGSYGMALSYKDAYTRLRADTSMALALLHHLAGSQQVSFETFAHVLHVLSRKAAIVEFVPREDRHISDWPLAREPWYDIDHLIRAMRPYFSDVEILPSSPAPRQLLLFRKNGRTTA